MFYLLFSLERILWLDGNEKITYNFEDKKFRTNIFDFWKAICCSIHEQNSAGKVLRTMAAHLLKYPFKNC